LDADQNTNGHAHTYHHKIPNPDAYEDSNTYAARWNALWAGVLGDLVQWGLTLSYFLPLRL
jgi:hypothetical protein